MRVFSLLIFLSFLTILFGCKKEFDNYYARPSSLKSPIYQQLEAKGNFTCLLKLIDKANFENTLSSGGFWTLLAPNDEAFKSYLSEKGFSSIDNIDSTLASNIVRYLLIYNKYDTTSIDNYQDGSNDDNNSAFRRKTAYYRWVYSDTTNGIARLVIDRVNNSTTISANDNNNKYIPYFTANYINSLGLTSADYTSFYPNASYLSFNICGGNSIGGCVFAENGYYLEINKVIEPLPNIYEYVKSKSKYSAFKKLLDRFATFTINNDFQSRYLQATGLNTSVYHKYFNDTLAFSPNGESYSLNSNDAQYDSWSILVPENDAVNEYVTNVLAEYYNNDPYKVPNNIIAEFINSHMWQTTVWPSNFNKTYDYLTEFINLDINSDVTDKQILSNGMFYGSNKVYESRTFTSVYAQAFLNPAYSYMLRLMSSDNYKNLLKKKDKSYTVFMVKDSAFASDLFTYNTNYKTWYYNGSTAISGELVSTATQKITRDFQLQVIESKIEDVSSTNTVETFGGECITLNNGTVYGAGNEDSSEVAKILGYRDYDNGRVYFIDKILKYGQLSIYGKLRVLAGYNLQNSSWGAKTEFYPFYKIIATSGLLSVSNNDTSVATINGVSTGDVFTVLVPNLVSITLAQNSNDSSDISNIHPYLYPYDKVATNVTYQTVNANFIKYHFLNKIIIPDGNEDKLGVVNTVCKDLDGNAIIATVTNVNDGVTVQGYKPNSSATLILGSSNRLASKAIFHLVSGFLKYE
jgi:uncharacterized surface protein with fasciclin (FAS1) repeats